MFGNVWYLYIKYIQPHYMSHCIYKYLWASIVCDLSIYNESYNYMCICVRDIMYMCDLLYLPI